MNDGRVVQLLFIVPRFDLRVQYLLFWGYAAPYKTTEKLEKEQ